MRAAALLLLAASAAAGPVVAQSTPVDRPALKPSWPVLPNITTRSASIEPVVGCLWQNGAKDSAAFLSTALLSKAEQQTARKLLDRHRSCIGRPLAFSTPVGVLRGALAGKRLARPNSGLDAFGHRPSRSIGRVSPIDGRPFLVSYAACLAVGQPGWAAAFLQTPAASEGERRQFLQFGNALSDCMPQGRNYNVDIPALRDEMAAVVDLMIVRGDGA